MTSQKGETVCAKPHGESDAGDVDVSVIIVSWNTQAMLRDCLGSVYEQTRRCSYEIICVDNGSTDNSAAMVRKDFPNVRCIANRDNLGFVEANNQAIRVARGRYVLLLNSDTIVLDGAIERTVRFADLHPEAAVVGCKVVNPDMTLQRSCTMYPSVLNMFLFATFLYKLFPTNRFFGRQHMTWWEYDDVREVQTVSGCFSLVRRQAINDVGKMDPVYFFYGDDPDWCYRFTRKGWKVLFTPEARIVHFGGQSTRQNSRAFRLQLFGSILIFMRLHRCWIEFLLARFLTAVFFFFRATYWLAMAVVANSQRSERLGEALTCMIGSAYSLFGWKKLLMNREDVKKRLTQREAIRNS